jgi:lysyl-tRNA synthetase class 2
MSDTRDLSSSSEHEVRLAKIEALRAQGMEPWPERVSVTATTKEVLEAFVPELSAAYVIAGRVVSLRLHGKALFAHIQDRTGRLQIYARADVLGQEKFEWIERYIDIGDIIWCKGSSFKTKAGEITLKVEDCGLLSKSLHPLPEKFHGLTDIETIYRQRYLDLIGNAISKERFIKRSHIIKALRSFLDSRDFLEVETPMLHPIAGGAAARPFMTHHNALDSQFYLRIAPELYLKRLVVGGLERVYEINRNFRNEGISTRHNPEFTMLEFYMAHEDYLHAMDVVEDMIRYVLTHTNTPLQIPFNNYTLDFGIPFVRMRMTDAICAYARCTMADLQSDTIDKLIAHHHISLHTLSSYGHKIYALFEALVEDNLIQPTFITHFPIEMSPLAKRDPQDPTVAARFELFIAGMELSNGFTELNDPIDQAARFKEQAHAREAGDAEAHYYDAEYIRALEQGMAPAAGVGIGIDRLVMLLTNTTSIKDVILFPTLKKL